jgi:hypothetical protein
MLEVRELAKMEGGVPLGLAVISFFSGLEAEGWVNEVRGLWAKTVFEDAGEVESCDDVIGAGASAEVEVGNLKEKFGVGCVEESPPKVTGGNVVAGAVAGAGLSVVGEGVWLQYK